MTIDKDELALIAKFHQKKLKVIGSVGRIAKNGRNDFQKYDYATESDIADGLREEMAKQGLSYRVGAESWSAETTGTPSTVHTAVTVRITLIDTETGYSESDLWFGWADDKGDKGGYKAYTGAQKYALMKTFMLSTGDDPENDEQGQTTGRQNQTKPGQARQAPARPQPQQNRPVQPTHSMPHKAMEIHNTAQAAAMMEVIRGTNEEQLFEESNGATADPRLIKNAAMWGKDRAGQPRCRGQWEHMLGGVFSAEQIALMSDANLKRIVKEELAAKEAVKKQGSLAVA